MIDGAGATDREGSILPFDSATGGAGMLSAFGATSVMLSRSRTIWGWSLAQLNSRSKRAISSTTGLARNFSSRSSSPLQLGSDDDVGAAFCAGSI